MTPAEIIQSRREQVAERARAVEAEIVAFLRDLIAIPAESGQEGPVAARVRQEMERVGFDEVRVDPMGNVLGRIGSGRKVIMMDSHLDTVGVGDRREWAWDPYQGKVEDGYVYGRGACDQRAGIACLVYAGCIIKELALTGDYTFYAVGSVQEEDCDGLPWLYILREDKIAADCVVLTEPTNLRVYRGHRGRMEIELHLRGVSCHASAPERGDNAVYKMARLVAEVEKLNLRLRSDPFLGRGSVAVTEIRSLSPSLCAVPSACSIHLDRRLTAGDTKESALAEVKALPGAEEAEIEVLQYDRPSYTGLVYPMEKYYPTWLLAEDHPLVRAGVSTFETVFGRAPVVDKWTFSTNGVGSMGVSATQFYAAFPLIYLDTVGGE
jgi:putative selenium metabolism hydrolase